MMVHMILYRVLRKGAISRETMEDGIPVTTHIVDTKKCMLMASSTANSEFGRMSDPLYGCGGGVRIYESGIAGGRPKVMLRVRSSKTQANHVRVRVSRSSGVYAFNEVVECRPSWKAALTAMPCMFQVMTERCVPCRYWLISSMACTVSRLEPLSIWSRHRDLARVKKTSALAPLSVAVELQLPEVKMAMARTEFSRPSHDRLDLLKPMLLVWRYVSIKVWGWTKGNNAPVSLKKRSTRASISSSGGRLSQSLRALELSAELPGSTTAGLTTSLCGVCGRDTSSDGRCEDPILWERCAKL